MYSFLGRESELAELERELRDVQATGTARFVWLRGRRRVGKSRLVQELCDRVKQPYVYFQAPQRDRDGALADFADAAAAADLPDASFFEGTRFAGWSQALGAVTAGATPERPLIVVIDELPYLVEGDDGFAADLQRAWDRVIEGRPVLLIAVGSDVRMMEELVRERSPLHGRPTRQMRIDPLDPATVGRLGGATSAADAFERYLVVGGLPALAALWPAGASRKEFLRDALRDDQAPLVVQALWILDGELQGGGSPRKVLQAIGAGEVAFNRIMGRAGVSQRGITQALATLIDAKGLVRRDEPFSTMPLGKSARYTVVDPYLRFWLRFVAPHLDELARGRGDALVDRIERDWMVYRGRAIEPLVRRALELLLAEPERSEALGGARTVGAWWRRDNSVEVDLVGGDAARPTAIGFVGSIKWREQEPFGESDVTALARHRAAVPGAEQARLVGVSRSGFDPDLRLDAELTPEDLIAAW